jgi:hypothetical protein
MSGRTMLGLVLAGAGIVILAYKGLSYTTHERVLDIGPVQATKAEEHNIPLPPIVGGLALVGGIVVLVTGRRRT